jgi:hypothetical protein
MSFPTLLQPTADRFAALASARMATMFQLRSTVHVYDPEPGDVNSVSIALGKKVVLKDWRRAEQPYRDLDRFSTEERVMQHVIDRGLLPIVTTLSKEIMGKKLLVTRRPSPRKSDLGVVAHLDGYGIRIEVHFDAAAEDVIVAWECLYGSI